MQIQQSTGVETVDEAQKLLEGTEYKMERHLRDWADKWRDTLLIMEVWTENVLAKQKIIQCFYIFVICFRKMIWVCTKIVQHYVLIWILHILSCWMMILSIQVLPYSV